MKNNELQIVPFKKLKNTKAWKLTSELVRKSARGKCFTCGRRVPFKKMVAGHFREKIGNSGVYFDLDNLRGQCGWFCNKNQHGAKDIYAKKLIEEIGKKRFDNLFKKSVKPKQWTRGELNKIAEEVEIKLKKMEWLTTLASKVWKVVK
jgi:hypothetical protein